MKNSFILYTNYFDILKDLSDSDLGIMFRAILSYQTNGEYNIPKHLELAFKFIKNQLDVDEVKYNDFIEKQRLNGLKGGRPKTQKTQAFSKKPKKPKLTQKSLNDNDNVNDNVNVNVNENDNDKQIEQPKQTVAVVPKKVPQQRVFDYFADKYKALTGFKYKSKSSDFVNLAKLIKDYGEDKVNQKIDWLEVGCVNRVFWFAKESGVNSFTIGNLVRNWNEILPQYTKEQLQEMERKRQEEESMKRVLANAQKLRLERESWKNE